MESHLNVPIDRARIVERLGHLPPIESLFTADDLERQKANAERPMKAAAVLVLVVNHADAPTVVLTERTALREAEEEVGVDPSRVEVLGRLPEYHTSTGFNVTPFVGWIEPPVAFHPDPHEVEEVFEVPLAFLLDPGNHRYESAFFKGRMRHYWAMPYGHRFIWGATAGMLVTLQRILAGAGESA